MDKRDSYSHVLVKTIAVIWISWCAFGVTSADLTRSQFTDLVSSSDLIVQGRVIRARLTGPYSAGEAVLSVKSVYKGTYPKSELVIRWTTEVHDQRVDRVGEHRLLFLKHTGNAVYEGTHYGVSYWVIHKGTYGRLFIPYVYPTTKIDIAVPKLLRDAAEVAPDDDSLRGAFGLRCQAAQVILLEDVLAYIAGHQ